MYVLTGICAGAASTAEYSSDGPATAQVRRGFDFTYFDDQQPVHAEEGWRRRAQRTSLGFYGRSVSESTSSAILLLLVSC